jgi:predicted RNase H-like HicB family nuclease
MAKTEIAERISTTKMKGKEELKFTLKIEYQEADKGYLIKCPELDAVAWGKTLAEAKAEIVESIIDVTDVLLEMAPKNDGRLKHAKLIKSCSSREEIEELLGL